MDKNYLLEEAQLQLESHLLTLLVNKVKEYYILRYNPLRLTDSVSQLVLDYKPQNLQVLNPFYQNLAGVYRYKFGNSQLEFLWDGKDHSDQYKNEWSDFYNKCTDDFCGQELFIKAVLDLTVFLPENRQAQLAENRMNHFILQQFEVRIHKQKGIVEMKVA
jgi:hypothetical protein